MYQCQVCGGRISLLESIRRMRLSTVLAILAAVVMGMGLGLISSGYAWDVGWQCTAGVFTMLTALLIILPKCYMAEAIEAALMRLPRRWF